MANTIDITEVEKTPSKDVTTDGPTEGTEEDGAGQMPDSMSIDDASMRVDRLITSRHLPGHHQAPT